MSLNLPPRRIHSTRGSLNWHRGGRGSRSVALVTGSLSRMAGGLFSSARIPANRMAEKGHSPVVYGLEDVGWPAAADEWAVSRIRSYRTMGPARFGAAPEMGNDLLRGRHDLIHLRGLWSYPSWAAARARRSGVPLLISPEGMLDPWALSQSPRKKALALWLFERENLKHARALHALNDAEANHVRSFGLSNPIAVIPNGVDLPIALSNEHRVGGERILLFLGRIHPKKGLSELLSAWAAAIAASHTLRATWKIHIAGWDDGGHEGGLKTKVRRLGLENDVRFRGTLFGDAKDSALRDASAFILPSRSEGQPIAALEAAAYGLPLFVTPECNLPEFVDSGAAVQIQNAPEIMARQLLQHLDGDYASLAAAGAIGRAITADRFDWSRIVDQYLSLYEWAISGGSPPRGLDLR